MNDYFKEDNYWKKHIKDVLEDDLWIINYKKFLPLNASLLDLGCGRGNYTKYFKALGYEVTSADISDIALEEVKKINKNVIKIDMRKTLPFENESFDIVFANLSIHYFDDETTKKLISEIKRILTKGGIFMGSVNSFEAYDFIKDHAKELSYHFYLSNDMNIRLFDEEDINNYLKEFGLLACKEEVTMRFGKQKNYIIFIAKKTK